MTTAHLAGFSNDRRHHNFLFFCFSAKNVAYECERSGET
jgi:hypothetical protein